MNLDELEDKVKYIVSEANSLKNKYTKEFNASVNYACIFSQSKEEYLELEALVKKNTRLIKETKTGNLYQINPIKTVAGDLRILKIRLPDETRPEIGCADFDIGDYDVFKTEYLSEPAFKLIEREAFEMIELMDSEFNVRTYFPNLLVEI